jgi:hypothetical protein
MKIAIINGPNLNLLGTRETDIYGNMSFEDFLDQLTQKYPSVEFSYYQSNIEGEIINALQLVGFEYEGSFLILQDIHTSVAIGDAIAASKNSGYRSTYFKCSCPGRFSKTFSCFRQISWKHFWFGIEKDMSWL